MIIHIVNAITNTEVMVSGVYCIPMLLMTITRLHYPCGHNNIWREEILRKMTGTVSWCMYQLTLPHQGGGLLLQDNNDLVCCGLQFINDNRI